MNPKIEKLLKLPLYQRVSILSVLLLLVVGAFVWFLWLPEFEKLGEMEQEVSRLDTELIQKRQIANNLPKFKEEFAKMERLLEEALTQLPNKQEIPSLLTSLATLAKESGLEVVSFTPRGEVNKGFYAEVAANLDLIGSYHQVVEFAQAVSRLSRIVNLNDLTLTMGKVEDNRAVLRINCKVTTFRFVEQ